MNKYAILSTDNNPDYYNLLPLVCYSWEKIGYIPVIIFVNVPYSKWKIIMDACPTAKSHVLYSVEGVKDSTLAQLQRLFMGKHTPNLDDIITTADADMVIGQDIFTHDVSQGQIVSYGYDLTGRSELPICYVKATAAIWRELMGEFTIPDKSYSDKWEDYWSVDQQLLTQRAREYGMDKISFIDRGNQNKHGLPTGRWDRHDFAHIPDTIIDVHMPRNDWAAQINVFERLWPGEDHSFIMEFKKAIGVGAQLDISIQVAAQAELVFISESDTHGFLQGVAGNWDNHRPLLLLGLALTTSDVYEFGAGDGSTPFLRAYCKANKRHFQSWENNKEWAEKCGSVHVADWNNEGLFWHAGLVFIDQAPGEQRHLTIAELARRNDTDIIVIHDTEEGGAGDYKFEKIWHLFKFRLNLNKNGGGAGATAVSNTIDLNRFRGLTLGQYAFDHD